MGYFVIHFAFGDLTVGTLVPTTNTFLNSIVLLNSALLNTVCIVLLIPNPIFQNSNLMLIVRFRGGAIGGLEGREVLG